MIEAVISQALLPRIEGGRIGTFEIMLASTAVRNLIREEKLHELRSVMELSSKDGMQTLDQSLADLVRRRIVNQEEAIKKSSNPGHLKKLLEHSIGFG